MKRTKNIVPEQPAPTPRPLDPKVKEAMDDVSIRFEDIELKRKVKK